MRVDLSVVLLLYRKNEINAATHHFVDILFAGFILFLTPSEVPDVALEHMDEVINSLQISLFLVCHCCFTLLIYEQLVHIFHLELLLVQIFICWSSLRSEVFDELFIKVQVRPGIIHETILLADSFESITDKDDYNLTRIL